MTPDAEDFLRSRISEMPPGMQPVLLMTTEQSDGLNPPRWSYKDESFVIGYFDPNDKPEREYTKVHLFGHTVVIESNALKNLSGRVLGLRRVDAKYGIMRDTRYVLKADSVPASPTDISSTAKSGKIRRGFLVVALTILGGFTGMGIFWIIYGIIAAILRIPEEKLFQTKVIFLLFPPGWILGAIVSFFFFRSVFKADGETQFKQEQIQRKYFGSRGSDTDWWVFLGVPVPLTLPLIFFIDRFVYENWEISAVAIVSIIAIFGPCLYFCDKVPRRLIMRLGILGWMVTFIEGYLFLKIHGP
jgi:hypothetical protein